MNGKNVTRVVLDAVLTIMIIAEMFIQYTGVFLHEVIGFAFFATVVTHLALSAKWIKNTASSAKQGKMTGRRTALAVMGILLAVNIVVLGVSSVAISTILAQAGFTWTLGSYAIWTTVHSVSSYTLCALVTVHLAMHWAFLASAFRVPYDPSRRRAIGTGVHAVAAMSALALGVMAVNQVAPQISGGNGNGSGNGAGTGEQTQARRGHAFDSVSDVQGESDASASSTDSSSGLSGEPGSSQSTKGKSKTRGNASNVSGDSSNGAPSGPDAGDRDAAPSQGADNGPEISDSDGGSSTATGICTLCRKQCPLSAPLCDKPYRAGLL